MVPWTSWGSSKKNPISVLAFTSNNPLMGCFSAVFSWLLAVLWWRRKLNWKKKSVCLITARQSYLQYPVPLLKVRHVALLTQGALSSIHCRAARDKRRIRDNQRGTSSVHFIIRLFSDANVTKSKKKNNKKTLYMSTYLITYITYTQHWCGYICDRPISADNIGRALLQFTTWFNGT